VITVHGWAARKLHGVRKLACFLLVLFALLGLFVAGARAGEAAHESAVEKVRVEGLSSINEAELLYLLDIRPGETLDADTVRRGIKRAFLKGIFEEISVETDPEDSRTVVVKVRERDFIRKVVVMGNELVAARVIEQGLDLKEGETMRYDLIAENTGKLRDLLRLRGFPLSEVRLETVRTETQYRVDLVVQVDEGEPEMLSDIVVHGRPAADVTRLMSLKEGDVYDQMKLAEDLEKIDRRFREMGYLNPVVGPYTFSDGRLHLSVEAGRKLDIEIKGNDSVASKALRNVMPFYEAREMRDDLIEEAVRRMLDLYHEKGFPSAQIAPIVTEEEQETILSFYVFEGEKVLVDFIRITGASIPEEKLKEIMALGKRSAYNPGALDDDIRSIRELYIALGYANVKVGKPTVRIVDDIETSLSWARIQIDVEEGERVLISGVFFEGVRGLDEGLLRNSLNIRAGDPYNEVDISDARRKVLAVYRSEGYYDCEVEVSKEFTVEGARVSFAVREGEKLYFGKTVVRGNRKTMLRVVTREFEHREDMPFDDSLLMKSRLELYRLGLFSSVEVRPLDRADDRMDVLMDIREGKAGTIEFGVGYGEYERYRAFFDIGYKNLYGLNRQISLRTELDSLSNRIIVNYYEPWLFNRPVENKTFLLREERKDRNIDTGEVNYRVLKYTASTGIEKRIGARVRATLYYEYSIVETFDVKPGVVLSREDTGTLSIISLSPGIIYDSRDDPFDPQGGVLAGIKVKPASKLIMSETDFVKVTLHASHYRRLARWLVAAVSFRGGVAKGFRETDELPLVERFFLGGRSTVRGYNQDSLGPKTQTTDRTPIGGNAFLLGNFELRTRVVKNWRIVPFVDTGNVWSKVHNVKLAGLKYTTGLGIQYNTPAGPIRLDYGYKLDREPGESKSEIHFSLGYAF